MVLPKINTTSRFRGRSKATRLAFLRGVSKNLDLAGNNRECSGYDKTLKNLSATLDGHALSLDWHTVGNDIYEAIDLYAEEEQQDSKDESVKTT